MTGGWMPIWLMWLLLYWAVLSILVESWLLLQEWECHLEDRLRRTQCSVLEPKSDDDTCYRQQVSWGNVLPNMRLKLSHTLNYWVGTPECVLQLNITKRSFVDLYLVDEQWSVGTPLLYQVWRTTDEFWNEVLCSKNLVGPWFLLVEYHSVTIHWKSSHFHQSTLSLFVVLVSLKTAWGGRK